LSTIFFPTNPAPALEPIPRESGFSGFFQPGVGYMRYKTNMVARLWTFKLSEDTIDSLSDSPDEKSSAVYFLTYSLGYTFASTRTQLFVGTDLTDLIRLDYGQQVGVKQEIGKLGLLQGGFLFNTIYYKNPWGWSLFGSSPMNFYINAAYLEVDANIDFYDQQAFFSTAGLFFKW
jgi:hypothetical protein